MNAPYREAVCRGSIMLGSACGRCERCKDERTRMMKALGLDVIVTAPAIVNGPGCICPPTSEQTCQAPTCPRRPYPGYIAS